MLTKLGGEKEFLQLNNKNKRAKDLERYVFKEEILMANPRLLEDDQHC